jgi:hypothetical protein
VQGKPHIVTWRLKAGIVKSEERSIVRQRLGKHIPAATNTHATIEEPVSKQPIGKHRKIGVLQETVFSVRFVQSGYKEEFSWEKLVEFRDMSLRAEELTETVSDGGSWQNNWDNGKKRIRMWREDFMCDLKW